MTYNNAYNRSIAADYHKMNEDYISHLRHIHQEPTMIPMNTKYEMRGGRYGDQSLGDDINEGNYYDEDGPIEGGAGGTNGDYFNEDNGASGGSGFGAATVRDLGVEKTDGVKGKGAKKYKKMTGDGLFGALGDLVDEVAGGKKKGRPKKKVGKGETGGGKKKMTGDGLFGALGDLVDEVTGGKKRGRPKKKVGMGETGGKKKKVKGKGLFGDIGDVVDTVGEFAGLGKSKCKKIGKGESGGKKDINDLLGLNKKMKGGVGMHESTNKELDHKQEVLAIGRGKKKEGRGGRKLVDRVNLPSSTMGTGKPKTKWQTLVSQIAKQKNTGIKEAIKYIKENNLYKK